MSLLTPLFIDGMYNSTRKQCQMHEAYPILTTTDGTRSYMLYEKATKNPENPHAYSPYDERYLHVMVNGFAVPLRMTMLYLTKMFVRKGECDPALALKVEEGNTEATKEIIRTYPNRLADIIHNFLAESEKQYQAAKKSIVEDGEYEWPDYIGACVAQELVTAQRLVAQYKEHKAEEERKQKEEEARSESEAMAKAIEELDARVKSAIQTLKTGGEIKNDMVVCYLLEPDDRRKSRTVHFVPYLMEQCGVVIKGRTPGWLNEKLGSFSVYYAPGSEKPTAHLNFCGKTIPEGVRNALWDLIHAAQQQ